MNVDASEIVVVDHDADAIAERLRACIETPEAWRALGAAGADEVADDDPAVQAVRDEQVRAVIQTRKFEEAEFLVFATRNGVVKKTRLAEYKANRDKAKVDAALAALVTAAKGTDNLLYPMKEALRADATLGEISDALRGVFGIYQP